MYLLCLMWLIVTLGEYVRKNHIPSQRSPTAALVSSLHSLSSHPSVPSELQTFTLLFSVLSLQSVSVKSLYVAVLLFSPALAVGNCLKDYRQASRHTCSACLLLRNG